MDEPKASCLAGVFYFATGLSRLRNRRWFGRQLAGRTAICAAVVLSLFVRSASAARPSTDAEPTTPQQATAEKKLATKGRSMVNSILQCQRKTLLDASNGKPYDATKLTTCLQKAKTKWLNATSSLVGSGTPLPNALSEVSGTSGAFDTLNTELMRATGTVYCCGTVPLPGDFSGTVPDPSSDPTCTFKNLDKTMKDLEKFANALLQCHINFVKDAIAGTSFSLTDCESQAETTLGKQIAALPGLPACLQSPASLRASRLLFEISPAILSGLVDGFRSQAGQVAIPGSPPIFLDMSGCCVTAAASCTTVAHESDCNAAFGAFIQGVECNTQAGICAPNSCPYPSTCDPGEDASNCPQNCSAVCGNGICEPGEECTLQNQCTTQRVGGSSSSGCCCADCSCGAGCGVCQVINLIDGLGYKCSGAFCGDGICEAGETCSSCPADCGVCPPVCGNGKCEVGESVASCPADCVPPYCGSPPCSDFNQNCCQNNCCTTNAQCIAATGGAQYQCFSGGCCYIPIQ